MLCNIKRIFKLSPPHQPSISSYNAPFFILCWVCFTVYIPLWVSAWIVFRYYSLLRIPIGAMQRRTLYCSDAECVPGPVAFLYCITGCTLALNLQSMHNATPLLVSVTAVQHLVLCSCLWISDNHWMDSSTVEAAAAEIALETSVLIPPCEWQVCDERERLGDWAFWYSRMRLHWHAVVFSILC